jgi:SAM-dependent methyltransferase
MKETASSEIEANKKAWGSLAEGHYEYFKKAIQDKTHRLNHIIEEELGDISGKSIIHLQCNTGADTVLLAQKGAIVTGVDLVPENIFYAKKMAQELEITNINFIESDIMTFADKHDKKYDMVFTSEGALVWLPDLNKWAETVKHLLKKNGVLYVFDSHPFMMTFDEEKFKEHKLELKYPYFVRDPEYCEEMDDYCTENKTGETYEWMYKVSDLINPLAKRGFKIEFFNEHDSLYYYLGGLESLNNGLCHYTYFDKKFTFSFSLKATLIE